MRVWTLALCLFFISSAAYASWERVTSSEEMIMYADPATRFNLGGSRYLWVLWDYKEKNCVKEGCYRSTRVLFRFDCAAMKLQGLYLLAHEQQMGYGEIIAIANGNDLNKEGARPIKPGTYWHSLSSC